MPTAVEFQFDSDQLQIVADRFNEQVVQLEETISDLENQLNNLKFGGWLGNGATRFYDEMDNVFMPNMDKLKGVFDHLSLNFAKAAKAVQDAEDQVKGTINATYGGS